MRAFIHECAASEATACRGSCKFSRLHQEAAGGKRFLYALNNIIPFIQRGKLLNDFFLFD